MPNEQRRAERIQSEFQKLLAELKSQDEQVKALFEREGLTEGDLPEVEGEGVEDYLEAFDEAVAERRAELLRHKETPKLNGLVLRA